jgi:apolipoprotein N-acyltransferase
MYGVNLVVCLMTAGLFLLWEYAAAIRVSSSPRSDRARWVYSFAWLGYAVALVLIARIPMTSVGPPLNNPSGVPVAVVQTNVPQSNKQFATLEQKIAQFADALRLTREANDASMRAFGERPAFIAWPETMFPGTALNDDAVDALRVAPAESFAITGDLRDALVSVQTTLGTPFLIGAVAVENPRVVPAEEEGYVRLVQDGIFNSVFLIQDGAIDTLRYDKIHLTPFGEVMPLISRSDWLEKQLLALGAPGMSFDLVAGTEAVRFDINGLRVATPICFEATIPHICRRLVFEGGERKADILVNLTNDGWFGATDSARRDHMILARWRAAELATPVIRAANTGVSCFIDAKGRVYAAQDADSVWRPGDAADSFTGLARTDAVLLARITPGEGTTLYGRTGDIVGWAVFLVGCGLTVLALLPTKNRANPSPSPNAVEPTPD